MQLLRFGFNGRLKIPQAGRADIDGVRVDVMHAAGLYEWFINTPLGIEQGFTLMPVFAERWTENSVPQTSTMMPDFIPGKIAYVPRGLVPVARFAWHNR